jgi:hypothetical protein
MILDPRLAENLVFVEISAWPEQFMQSNHPSRATQPFTDLADVLHTAGSKSFALDAFPA